MKLNLHTIGHEIGHMALGKRIGSSCNDARLDYPLLLDPSDRRYYDNVLYVALARHLDEAREKIRGHLSRNPSLTFSCLCIGEPPEFCLDARNCDIVWTDARRSTAEAFNAAQGVFQRLGAWERELDAIIECGGSLPDLVNASTKVFKNDLCVTDPYSRVLAHRVYRSNRFTREQTDLIEEGAYLPKSMMLDGVEDERSGEDFSSLSPTFSTMTAFQCTVLRATVKLSSDYALIVSVHPNFQPVGEKDCALVQTLAKAIGKYGATLGHAGAGDPAANAASILKATIKGERVSDADAARCAMALGWDKDADEYLCSCLDFAPNTNMRECRFLRPSVALCGHLQKQFECAAFSFEGGIVVVANLTREGASEDDACNRMASFANDFQLVVGMGAPFCGLRGLPGGYRQAAAALKLGYQGRASALIRFCDHALDIGMGFIAKEMETERFCPRPLVELALQRQDLLYVLRAYLEENCNSNRASKRLGLQRNSFVYKLQKTRKLLRMDWDDPDTRLLLLVSLKLIELYGLDSAEPLPPSR